MTLTSRHELETRVVTSTVRQASRKLLYWVLVAVAVLGLAIVTIIANGAAQSAAPSLSPTAPGPKGGKALAEVLRHQGVSVTAATSMRQVREVGTEPSATTIFLVDEPGYLDAAALRELAELSTNVIVMSPTFDQLDELAPSIALAGHVSGTVTADCSLLPVRRAESIQGDGIGFRVIDPDADTVRCFDSGDDVQSLIQLRNDSGLVTVIGARSAFSNEFVDREGNAALALGLLGETPNLVWLVPTIAEAEAADGAASIAELTPVWVSTIMTLFVLTAIAAGFWRGRRFGPLVVEALPVVVRASETMHGRARLYQKSSDYLHTLDALRMGTIDRLGVLCGLPTLATVDDVIRAVAAATGQQPAAIQDLLRDAQPLSEAQLVQFSDDLLKLEAATTAATRPSSATMDTTTTTTTTKPGEPGR